MKKNPRRFVCIHGHFYQPPRENPWLDAIEVQDSASPYHDWNERINSECYAPNSRSRILDAAGRIINVVNNYEFMSFNFGPSLLSWMSEYSPEIVKRMVQADRVSCERFNGHGNALAQVYNHLIMPLASSRDKETQVKWGIADFRYRFGRQPEGMWLAETAVDTPTLEALAAEGIRFTILAPRQAKKCRRIGEEEWVSLNSEMDTRVPYLCRLPSGKDIVIFFYNPDISHAIAFQGLLNNGDYFYNRLVSAFDSQDSAQLVNIATDGESYGHHHRFGDMALAYALEQLHKDPTVEIINYAAFLDRFPPLWEVKIHENSSWSCAHGVERWRTDCGCNTGHPYWNQSWRAPLRESLDWLKKQVDIIYESKGRQYFEHPWSARNAYIKIILDRMPESTARFFREYGKGILGKASVSEPLKLLEMQRHALLMFTSCGWFFDEISGLETTQILKYAGRTIQLAGHFGRDLESEFIERLEDAPSNVEEFENGKGVWERLIKPAAVNLERVAAHYALSSFYKGFADQDRVYSFDVTCRDHRMETRDSSGLAAGRLTVSSRFTLEQKEMIFAVIRFGSLDLQCALRLFKSPLDYSILKEILLKNFVEESIGDAHQIIVKEFPGKVYRLRDLFVEEQRMLIDKAMKPRLDEYDEMLEKMMSRDENVIKWLVSLDYPIPETMLFAISNSMDRQLTAAVNELPSNGSVEKIRSIWKHGRELNYRPHDEKFGRTLTVKLERILNSLKKAGEDIEDVLEAAERLIATAEMFAISLNLWEAQNSLLDYSSERKKPRSPIKERYEELALKLGLAKDILKWKK